jgi:hypothetical protein
MSSSGHQAISQEDIDLAMAIAIQEEENRRALASAENNHGGAYVPSGGPSNPYIQNSYSSYNAQPTYAYAQYGGYGGQPPTSVAQAHPYIIPTGQHPNNQNMTAQQQQDYAMAYSLSMQEYNNAQQAANNSRPVNGLTVAGQYRAQENPDNAQGGNNCVNWAKRGMMAVVSIVLIIMLYNYLNKK